jgi:hypothetical protein
MKEKILIRLHNQVYHQVLEKASKYPHGTDFRFASTTEESIFSKVKKISQKVDEQSFGFQLKQHLWSAK